MAGYIPAILLHRSITYNSIDTERSIFVILESKETTVAYRCPECGTGIMSVVGLFTLSADMIKLRCSSCSKSDMSVVYDKANNTVRITIPCIFCGKPHIYNVSTTLFFNKEFLALQCPYSNIDIGFIGESNNVKAELSRNEQELIKLMEENGIESLSDIQRENNTDLPDTQLMDIILYIIKDVDAEGKIFCKCHPNGHTPLADGELDREEELYDVELTDSGIKITCRECGAKRVIPTDSLLAANAFLNVDSITLE